MARAGHLVPAVLLARVHALVAAVRLAIADPPYPPQFSERFDTADGRPRLTKRSRARRWYGDGTRPSDERPADFHPDAGEWDNPARHRRLLEELVDTYDGWAIATTSDGVEHYRPLPVSARLLVWVKPTAMPTSHRIASSWEAVIVCPPPGRRGRVPNGLGGYHPQVPDVLTCVAPQGFPGAKPARWTRWVLDALGYDPDVDEFVDLFPGSGAVATAAAQGALAIYDTTT